MLGVDVPSGRKTEFFRVRLCEGIDEALEDFGFPATQHKEDYVEIIVSHLPGLNRLQENGLCDISEVFWCTIYALSKITERWPDLPNEWETQPEFIASIVSGAYFDVVRDDILQMCAH